MGPTQESVGQEAPQRQSRIANADQEVWVQQRVMTAINMALAIRGERQVQADDPIVQYAVRGVAEGAAFEIINTLGMRPELVNIRPYQNVTGTKKL